MISRPCSFALEDDWREGVLRSLWDFALGAKTCQHRWAVPSAPKFDPLEVRVRGRADGLCFVEVRNWPWFWGAYKNGSILESLDVNFGIVGSHQH